MAKKQTTAVPSKNKRQSDDQAEQNTYLSRAEREARTQRWVMLAMGVTLGVILVVLLSGIVYELILYPNQAVATVDGENITVAEFQPRVRFERWSTGIQLLNVAQIYGADMLTDSQSPFYQDYLALQPNQEYIMGRRVQDQMVDEIIVQREAEVRGITVSDEELETRIQEFFGYDPDGPDAVVEEPTEEPTEAPTPIVSPTPAPEPTATEVPEETPAPTVTPMPTMTPAPTLTADELLERYETNSTSYFDEAIEISGLSEEEIQAFFVADLLQGKLQDEFAAEVPTSEEQSDARHILVATEEEAQAVLDALADGEPFADLARSASTDGSASSGGELGWASPSNYVTEFGDAVANAEIGAIVGPIETQFGFHIIQVNAREVRDLTEDEITQRASQAYGTWLQEQRDAADISYPVDYIDRTPNDPTIYEMGLAISG